MYITQIYFHKQNLAAYTCLEIHIYGYIHVGIKLNEHGKF